MRNSCSYLENRNRGTEGDSRQGMRCAREEMLGRGGAGLAGATASQFWFLAFALQTPAAVRTLGLVEVVFAQLVSWRILREKLSAREVGGLVLLAAAVAIILQR